jgi:hypothetical protein
MYFAMIPSVMAYGINIYGCATKTNLEKLRMAQKKAVRTICKANYRAHTAPLFKELKICPLDDLITYSHVKFMHSFHFKKLPLSFAEMWQLKSERNPERALRNANDYFIPAHRIEIVKRLPLISLPTAWNSAPGDKYNVVGVEKTIHISKSRPFWNKCLFLPLYSMGINMGNDNIHNLR